jgi:hypothetical protein
MEDRVRRVMVTLGVVLVVVALLVLVLRGSPWAAPYLCRGAVPSEADAPLWDAPLCWTVPDESVRVHLRRAED